MKYAFISAHRSGHAVKRMCRVLSVSTSGYYDWVRRPESRRQQSDRYLLGHIRRIHTRSRQHYGILKCWRQLKREGIDCGRDRVARLRREHGVYSKRRRRYVVTTRSKHRHWIAPNRLQRDFTSRCPNAVWVGDVTFIHTRCGWLYLAVLLDLYSRKVVGWSMRHRNDGQLVKDCLEMAIQQRRPPPGLIHHSDQGSSYAMQSYRKVLAERGMLSSMSRKRDCWDNAVAESFFSNVKNELTYWRIFADHDEARAAIFEYIEVFYNRQRLHQTLNYVSPEEYELGVGVS
ncbi:MAG: IS3 family transposase [Gammaproteobacteria bacterium]